MNHLMRRSILYALGMERRIFADTSSDRPSWRDVNEGIERGLFIDTLMAANEIVWFYVDAFNDVEDYVGIYVGPLTAAECRQNHPLQVNVDDRQIVCVSRHEEYTMITQGNIKEFIREFDRHSEGYHLLNPTTCAELVAWFGGEKITAEYRDLAFNIPELDPSIEPWLQPFVIIEGAMTQDEFIVDSNGHANIGVERIDTVLAKAARRVVQYDKTQV